jgi:hypothetical protein
MIYNDKLTSASPHLCPSSAPCLYRHKVNGTNYGIKKAGCKRKEHRPRTIDRRLAER